MPSSEPTIFALLEDGFFGTAHQIAAETGVHLITVRKHLKRLKKRGVVEMHLTILHKHLAQVWAIRGSRIVLDNVVEAAPDAPLNVPIVARALLARPALHLWATGELQLR